MQNDDIPLLLFSFVTYNISIDPISDDESNEAIFLLSLFAFWHNKKKCSR